jgi:hypothetical protein
VVSESGSCLIASRSRSTIRIYKLMCDGYLQLSWRTVNSRWSLRESIEDYFRDSFGHFMKKKEVVAEVGRGYVGWRKEG